MRIRTPRAVVVRAWLPGAGRYRLAVDFETSRGRCTVEHHLVVESAPAP